MSRFPRFKPRRQLYAARQWPGFAVKVTAEDGTWGLGTAAGRPTAAVIEDAFAHILIGEDCLAIDKLWDMMFRVSKPFGTVGIATVAISAVDSSAVGSGRQAATKARVPTHRRPGPRANFHLRHRRRRRLVPRVGFQSLQTPLPIRPRRRPVGPRPKRAASRRSPRS